MKNFLILLVLLLCFAFVSSAKAQYNYPHTHNGNWHTHPHSAAHYHNYWGNVTYYPPTTIYRGTGIWGYTPGAVVGPNRNVIIGGSYGYWQYRSCQPYTYVYPYRWR